MPTPPAVPHYAVIFTSQRTAGDQGYGDAAKRMVELASQQPGFLGADSAREASGLGITVSYWTSLEAIDAWRRHVEHAETRNQGRARWYEHYDVRIAKVERAYGWSHGEPAPPDASR